MSINEIKREDFDKIIKSYAAICNRVLIEEIKLFYFNNLKTIPIDQLMNAIHVFGTRNHFASVAEILEECGYSAPLSRKEREEREEITEQKKLIKTPTDYHPCILYIMQLKSRELTQDLANIDFEKQKEKLANEGWNIGNITLEDKSTEEIVENNRKKRVNIFIQNFNCHKEEIWKTKEN